MNKIKNLNRTQKLGIICSLLVVVSIVIVLIGNSLATTESTILKNVTKEGLTFENASLDYSDGVSTFKVEVTNDNENTFNLKYINMKFTLEDKEYTLIGYIGDSIGKGETKEITASIDKNITSSTKLEYSIVK